MTAEEWRDGSDAQAMVWALQPFLRQITQRQLRLLAAGCCRRGEALLADPRLRQALEAAEGRADRKVTAGALRAAAEMTQTAGQELARQSRDHLICGREQNALEAQSLAIATLALQHALKPRLDLNAVCSAADRMVLALVVQPTMESDPPPPLPTTSRRAAEGQTQCDLLRDVFDGLFHQGPIEPAWLAWGGGTVPRLAQAIYDERAFEQLPILADALEDAGCADAVLLDHCRNGKVHVRGCWVVDRLLGKL